MKLPSALNTRNRAKLSWGARQVLHAPLSDKAEIARICSLLIAAQLMVRVLPLPRAARLFGLTLATGTPVLQGPEPAIPVAARRRLRLVAAVYWALPASGLCLRQSLVAGHRVRHLAPELCLGVRRVDGQVQAHAWIVVQGIAVDPGNYAILQSLQQPLHA